jgi:hypothetical protein
MLTQRSKKALERAIKLKYDEHVGNLLRLPEPHLSQILPNKTLPLDRILKEFNSDTSRELNRYGDAIHAEIFRVLEQANVVLDSQEKETILSTLKPYLDANLYKKRFETFLGSAERRLASYGLTLDERRYRIDIPRSLSDADAENRTNRISARISNDLDLLLDLLLEKQNSSTGRTKSVKWYSKVNNLQRDHPFLFWLVPVLISLIGLAIGIITTL